MSDALTSLKARMARISRLGQAAAVLGWDQETYMPRGGAEARAEQLAVLSELAHETFVSDETGSLLAKSEADTQGQPDDSDDVRMLRVLRREFDRETKLPTELVSELARHSSLAQEVWKEARQADDFGKFAPALEKMFDLTRQKAERYGYTAHIYDALIDAFEPGATQAEIAQMFADMKPGLVSLTHAIADSDRPVDDAPVRGKFPVAKQRELTLKVVKAVGFDTERGRQDEAAHPFCTNFGNSDVRLTTRYNEEFLNQGLYASLHEAGHGMYEQGSPDKYEGTPLSGGVSLGVHESQSRMWENLVGRSRAFSQWVFPLLAESFPGAFDRWTPEDYYRAVNKVEPSLIRVEADEVTYNLHILLRFEMECDLLTGTLTIKDIPEAWNAKMQEYLGVTPPNNANGCLQDVHWSCGLIGYFPTYSVGNLISGQLWQAASAALTDLNGQIERGEFSPLLGWLRENVHGYGQKYLPRELVERATGSALTSRPYVDYLTGKYGDIYRL